MGPTTSSRRRPSPRSGDPPDGRLLARARPGIGAGQHYGYGADGPWAPEDGLRFDADEVLLDPYGRGVATPAGYRRTAAAGRPRRRPPMKSVVVDSQRLRLGGRPADRAPLPRDGHLRGARRRFHGRPELGRRPPRRGTYAGFIDKIPYLVDLGITAVELLPVFPFDRLAAPAGLVNHWGYQPVAFFAPHAHTRAARARPRPSTSSATWSRRSTGPASRSSSTSSTTTRPRSARTARPSRFRGLANDDYYLLDDDGDYVDDSGSWQHPQRERPIVRRLITDSLRYWVQEMHVDGFRFDLAAVLSRDEKGQRWPTRRSSGRSRRTRSSPARSSSPRRGTRAGCTRSAASSAIAGRVERPLPRRRAVLRQGRSRDGPGGHASASSAARTSTATSDREPGEHQLRHLPRRLHAQRPRLVRREAQRGERRGQPRRQRPEPELELRRRGPDRRPRDRGPARAARSRTSWPSTSCRSVRRCC